MCGSNSVYVQLKIHVLMLSFLIDTEMQMILQNQKTHLITADGAHGYCWEFARITISIGFVWLSTTVT